MKITITVECSDTAVPFAIPDCELDTTKCCVSCGRRGVYRKKAGDNTSVMTRFFACVCGIGFELAERPCGLPSEGCLVKAVVSHGDSLVYASVYAVFDSDLFQASGSVYNVLRSLGCLVEELTDAPADAEHRHTILRGYQEVPKEEIPEAEARLFSLVAQARSLGQIDNRVSIRKGGVNDSSDDTSGYNRGDCSCRRTAA